MKTPPPPNPDPPPSLPETVSIRVEAEPAGAHVFRKSDAAGGELADLGPVPYEAKVPRTNETSEYVLRSAGFKERVVSVEASRDQVLHVALERVPAPPRPTKPAPPRPARPHRPAVHDADGLAVPSF